MKIVAVLLATFVSSLSSQSCEPSPERIISVLKTEADTYNEYIFGRYLTTEWETCHQTNETMVRLQDNFLYEVEAMMKKAVLQIHTVEYMVSGTSAAYCVKALDQELSKFIDDESYRFKFCLEFPMLRLNQTYSILIEEARLLSRNYFKTIEAFDDCRENFPNDCLNATTNQCTKTHLIMFINEGKNITENMHFHSLCMQNFEESLNCFTRSVQKIASKAQNTLKKLATCADLTEDENLKKRIITFYKPLQIQTNLKEQVNDAQKMYFELNSRVVATLTAFYELEKSARMTYEFQPHDLEHFQKLLEGLLSAPLGRVRNVRPGSDQVAQCFTQAQIHMAEVVEEAAQRSVLCEAEILAETQTKMAGVRERLSTIIYDLGQLGNLAILDCLANTKYILAGDAIRDCYDLHYRGFRIEKRETMDEVDDEMEVLRHHNRTYFGRSESTLPCGSGDFNRTLLQADCTLFELSQCLYRATGDSGSEPSGTPEFTTIPTTVDFDDYTIQYTRMKYRTAANRPEIITIDTPS